MRFKNSSLLVAPSLPRPRRGFNPGAPQLLRMMHLELPHRFDEYLALGWRIDLFYAVLQFVGVALLVIVVRDIPLEEIAAHGEDTPLTAPPHHLHLSGTSAHWPQHWNFFPRSLLAQHISGGVRCSIFFVVHILHTFPLG